MKFQPDTLAGTNAISRFDGHRLVVGATIHTGSVVVPWRGAVQAWPPGAPHELRAEDFEALLALQPEVLLYGSGARLVFPPPALLRLLYERRVGLETMDSAAACRTFNVLASEGRSVVAALILGPG